MDVIYVLFHVVTDKQIVDLSLYTHTYVSLTQATAILLALSLIADTTSSILIEEQSSIPREIRCSL